MKKYNTLGLIFFLCFIIVGISFHFIFNSLSAENSAKLHNIDINRAYNEIETHGFGFTPKVSNYEYIQSISFLPANASNQDITAFFQAESSCSIKPFFEQDALLGFVKFSLLSNQERYIRESLQIIHIIFIVLFIFLLAIFLFIKYQIIAPFQKISTLPYELSKGIIIAPIEISKHRHFRTFIWGLNMLRDTLEQHKNAELELQKEKKTLLLSLSHDIKTPLNAMKLYTKALSTNLYTNQEKQAEIIQNMDKQTKTIEVFINDIVKASNEDFLKIEVIPSEFYLRELIEEIANYYGEKLSFLKTDFKIEPYDNPLLYGDLSRTIEVLQNVIENAIKYGDGRSIQIAFSEEDDCQLIIIRNSGNTLPNNELLKIFDSFWRGSNINGQTGSGLGLYICKQILHQMHGDIYAQTSTNQMIVTVVLKKS